jgi:hypothetical protein
VPRRCSPRGRGPVPDPTEGLIDGGEGRAAFQARLRMTEMLARVRWADCPVELAEAALLHLALPGLDRLLSSRLVASAGGIP